MPSPSGPRCWMTSHMRVSSSRGGVAPRVAIPAMPHIARLSAGEGRARIGTACVRTAHGPAAVGASPMGRRRRWRPPLAKLHADLVAHETQRRLQGGEPVEGDVGIGQRAQETGRRTTGIEGDGHTESHPPDLGDIVRERQRIGTGEVPDTQPRALSKVSWIAPEPRPAPLVPEEQRRPAKLLQQPAQEPSAAEEPFSGSPRNDPRYPERFGLFEQLANGTAVLESPGRAENQHFQALAAGDLPSGDDEEASLTVRGEHASVLSRRRDGPLLQPKSRPPCGILAQGELTELAEAVVLLAFRHQ